MTHMQRTKRKLDMAPLYDALRVLKTRDEMAAFLRDLCTRAELEAFAERIAIARALSKDVSYRTVADATGASVTTVSRVAHWLKHGQGGYRTALSRIKK
ncbi:MAG: hypothetical protein RLZZ283_20 [Candidatus Parcubacteria bacterium]|jgi:TrpR-related protein YerC/YecD